jgi:hypothetical protein
MFSLRDPSLLAIDERKKAVEALLRIVPNEEEEERLDHLLPTGTGRHHFPSRLPGSRSACTGDDHQAHLRQLIFK